MSRSKFYSRIVVDGIPQLDHLDTTITEIPTIFGNTYYTVAEFDIGRIDRISHINYGTSEYWWIICIANNISNPFEELELGRTLIIPSTGDIHEYYRKNKKR